jgi:hypothetical protein
MLHIQPAPVEIYPSLKLRLSPFLVQTLRELAGREGLSLSALVTTLAIEGLRARCRRRPSTFLEETP